MTRPRIVKRAVHGVLLLDKPFGLSSNDALQKVKRLYRAEKVGHTGTLDPLATGLLPLCFGAATKFSQTSLDADKRYTATLTLGQTTTTGDLEGSLVEERPVQLTRADIDAACARFKGPIEQRPPMHSALKHEGRGAVRVRTRRHRSRARRAQHRHPPARCPRLASGHAGARHRLQQRHLHPHPGRSAR